jgi:hypothetical protein
VKRVTRPMLGFKSLVAAQYTRTGIELVHMLKKGQMVVEEGAEGLTPAEQFYTLAASSPAEQGSLDHASKFATQPYVVRESVRLKA